VPQRHGCEQQLGKLPYVAQRERQALAVYRVVVSPGVAEQNDSVGIGFLAPGLLAAERRARPCWRDVPCPEDNHVGILRPHT
jgi:hypothetical protein